MEAREIESLFGKLMGIGADVAAGRAPEEVLQLATQLRRAGHMLHVASKDDDNYEVVAATFYAAAMGFALGVNAWKR